MSASNELEDSLQACREIQLQIGSEVTISDEEENLLETQDEIPVREEEESREEKPLPDNNKLPEQHPVLKFVLSILVCLFTALLLALLITTYVAHHTSVEGSSMEPTIEDGSQLVVEQISYYLHEPERFDVIVFPNNQGANYIKRIIGLPEETIQIKDGYVYINDKQLEEDYGKEIIEDSGLAVDKITLKKDEYFVLGDNRNGSIDSRRTDIGAVKREQIKGKALSLLIKQSRF